MKGQVFLHASEPRLGGVEDDFPRRARGRLEVFARLLAAAPRHQAQLVLVASDLLAPAPLDPGLLQRLAADLARAASEGIAVAVSAEAGEAAWLDLLAAQGHLTLLACPDAAGSAPPLVAIGRGLEVVGLGCPPSRAELLRRTERIPALPRGRVRVVLLGTRATPTPGDAELAALAAKAHYVALGGSASATTRGPSTFDPGPLLRRDLASAAGEPGYLRVELQRSHLETARFDAGDAPLLVLPLDASACSGPESLERELETALAGVPREPPPLLRIDLGGTPPFDPLEIDEAGLISLALERADAAEVQVRNDCLRRGSQGLEFRASTARADLERAAVERALAEAPAEERALAQELLDRLGRGETAGALAALAHHLERGFDARS